MCLNVDVIRVLEGSVASLLAEESLRRTRGSSWMSITSDLVSYKLIIMSLFIRLRAKLARGEERRGRPGPQPPAANMRQMVTTILKQKMFLK